MAFSLISLVILFFIHLCQGFLPLNTENIKVTILDLAFNNAISFVTNQTGRHIQVRVHLVILHK